MGLGCKNKKSRKIKRNLNVEKTEANLFQRSHVTGGCLGAKIMRISKRIASGMIKCRCVSWNYFKKENRTLEKKCITKTSGLLRHMNKKKSGKRYSCLGDQCFDGLQGNPYYQQLKVSHLWIYHEQHFCHSCHQHHQLSS